MNKLNENFFLGNTFMMMMMAKCAYVSTSNNQGKQDTSSAHFFLVIRYRNKTVDDEWMEIHE